MAFQRVPDTGQWTFKMSRGTPYPGDYPILSSVYVSNGITARNAAYFTGIAASLITWWTTFYGPRVPNTINLNGVAFRDLDDEFGVIGETPAAGIGSNASALAAGYAAVLVKLVGTVGDPPRSGRMYLGPVTEGDMDAGGDSITAGAATLWQTAVNALEAAATPGADDQQVIVSRFVNKAPRPLGVKSRITAWQVNLLAASQTRRRRLR